MTSKKIIIATVGSGGHIIPAINIYYELLRLKWKIYWIIDKNSFFYFKNFNIYNEIFIVKTINFKNLKFLDKIKNIYYLIKLIIYFKKIILSINPNILLSTGGILTFPICIISWIYKIPILIHEQNCTISLSNRLLSYISNKVLHGFKNKDFFIHKSCYTGNPVNNSIYKINNLSKKIKNRKGLLNILVLGGSQGSDFINKTIIKVLLLFNKNNINIWHQVGINNYESMYLKYKNLFLMKYIYKIQGFIKNISDAYLWSDFIISRSGALVVSEILYTKIPSILIPFPYINNHQYFNAIYLKEIGLSKIVYQSKFAHLRILNFLNIIDRNKLYIISKNCINKKNKYFSTKNIIDYIEKIKK